MPARTYMGVDSRNDHSFRVPRPDVSVEHKEVPNACNLCHTDKDATWATDAMKQWYGKVPEGKQNFSHALSALRSNAPDAPKSLYAVLTSDAPTLAKATVTEYLGNYPSKQTYTTTLQMLGRSDPMIRRAALVSLEAFPLNVRVKKTFNMLDDPVKVVRLEAIRQLTTIKMGTLEGAHKVKYDKVLKEYKETLNFTAERPETQLSIGRLHELEGKFDEAITAYEEALRLQPLFVPAYINYANFFKNQGKEKESKEVLEKGIKLLPKMAMLQHTLGLWYVRAKEPVKAIEALKRAEELDPNNARFSYVYAISIGKENPKEAIVILEKSYTRHPGNLSIISGLAYYYKQVGNTEKSEVYEKKGEFQKSLEYYIQGKNSGFVVVFDGPNGLFDQLEEVAKKCIDTFKLIGDEALIIEEKRTDISPIVGRDIQSMSEWENFIDQKKRFAISYPSNWKIVSPYEDVVFEINSSEGYQVQIG